MIFNAPLNKNSIKLKIFYKIYISSKIDNNLSSNLKVRLLHIDILKDVIILINNFKSLKYDLPTNTTF